MNNLPEQDLRILKVLLTEGSLALDFANNNDPKLLLGEAQKLGKIICDYIKKFKVSPTQRILIQEWGNDDSLRETIESVFEILPEISFDPREYDFEIDKLKKRFVELTVNDIKSSFKYEEESSAQSIAAMERALREIKEIEKPKESYTQLPIKDYLVQFKKDYEERAKNEMASGGIKTGYSYIDFMTGGFRPSEMWLVSAETSAGKSQLMANCAIQMWMQQNKIYTAPKDFQQGYNVLYFSLEMSYKSMFRRTISKIADLGTYNLRDSNLTKPELLTLSQSCNFIKKYPWQFEIVDVLGVDCNDILKIYEKTLTRFKPDLIVIDYLGLMEDINKEREDWLKLNNISESLHNLCRQLETRVMTAAQLNRLAASKKNPDKSEVVGIHRLGRSSQILHHVDVAIQIESRPEEHLRSDLPVHLIKNRDGDKGSCLLQKKFSNASVIDIPWYAPNQDSFGTLVSGFENDDISQELSKILNQ